MEPPVAPSPGPPSLSAHPPPLELPYHASPGIAYHASPGIPYHASPGIAVCAVDQHKAEGHAERRCTGRAGFRHASAVVTDGVLDAVCEHRGGDIWACHGEFSDRHTWSERWPGGVGAVWGRTTRKPKNPISSCQNIQSTTQFLTHRLFVTQFILIWQQI